MKYLFSFLFAGITMISFAQNNMGQMKGMKNFTPEQSAILQTKKMALTLDLNTSQQKQILELNKKQAIVRKKKMEAHKAMMSGDKKPTSDERFNMMNEMLDNKIAHQAKVKKILNKEQYEQWKIMQKNQMKKMHKNGKMMHGKNSHHKKGNGKGQGKKMRNN